MSMDHEVLDIEGENDEETAYGPIVGSRHWRGCLLQDE